MKCQAGDVKELSCLASRNVRLSLPERDRARMKMEVPRRMSGSISSSGKRHARLPRPVKEACFLGNTSRDEATHPASANLAVGHQLDLSASAGRGRRAPKSYRQWAVLSH